jgi:hypothetical protein
MCGHRPAASIDAAAGDQQHAKFQLPVNGCVENRMPVSQLSPQFRARNFTISATIISDTVISDTFVFHAVFDVAVDVVMAVATKTGIELMEACGREPSVPL